MELKQVIKSWKEASDASETNPIGEPVVDQNLISKVRGGGSSGWICTISGECNGGRSCNPFSIFQ